MNVLITGGSGFIGRHVEKMLLEEGHRVIAFSRSNVHDLTDKKNFQWIAGNLSTGEGLQKIPWETIECVIHLAAAGVKACKRNWAECIQVNIVGTERLLNVIKKRATQYPKVFIAKTFYEGAILSNPAFRSNPYVATKEASSKLTELWSEDYQGDTIFGTIYHTFGPDDDALSVLSYAARQFKNNKPAVFSSASALGDWLYISDVVTGILAAIKKSNRGISHWDIGSGNLIAVRDLIEQLQQISGRNGINAIFDASLDQPDIALHTAAKNLPPGFQPKFTMRQGLEEHYRLI